MTVLIKATIHTIQTFPYYTRSRRIHPQSCGDFGGGGAWLRSFGVLS
jgi:hypothetical protein